MVQERTMERLPTLDEWKGRAPRTERAAEHRGSLEMLAQAEVSASQLTGAPHWDLYLSYLQAAVEQTKAQRDAFAAAVNDPRQVDYATMMMDKLSMAECNGRIAAWEAAIGLPRELKDMGEQAKALLEKLPVVE